MIVEGIERVVQHSWAKNLSMESTTLGDFELSLSPTISSVTRADQNATLIILSSDFFTASCNLLESYA